MNDRSAVLPSQSSSHQDLPSGSHRNPWWPWLLTGMAVPPAGLLGHLVAGRVDSVVPAAVAGLITGAVIGAGQWALLRRRGVRFHWVAATTAALAVGLATGAALVSYRTDRPALALMGAVSGLAVGAAQAAATGARSSKVGAWAAATAGLWALGWQVSSGVIDVSEQWPIFGASGVLVATLLQSTFIERLLPLAPRAGAR